MDLYVRDTMPHKAGKVFNFRFTFKSKDIAHSLSQAEAASGLSSKIRLEQLLCGCRIKRSTLFRENDVLLQSREAVHSHVIDSKADSFHERDYVPFRGMKEP